MIPDPGHDLCQLGNSIGVVEHRAVSGLAFRAQVQPGNSLLCCLDQVEAQIIPDSHGEAAHLADGFGHVVEHVRTIVDDPVRTVISTRLLIGGEDHHDLSGGHVIRPRPVPQGGQQHGVHVLHIHRAAAPDQAVGELTPKGGYLPVLGERGHDIQVAV